MRLGVVGGRRYPQGVVTFDDPRFRTPLYTVSEAAEFVGMPATTLLSWTGRGGHRRYVSDVTPLRRGWPTLPLVGIVEAVSLRALRATMSPAEIHLLLAWMKTRYNTPHPLAHERLLTDGYTTFVEHDPQTLSRLRDGQGVILAAAKKELRPVIFAQDLYPEALRVERLPVPVIIDPRFNSGRMTYMSNRVPLFSVAGSLRAGESADEVAQGYGLTLDEVRAVERDLDWVEKAA